MQRRATSRSGGPVEVRLPTRSAPCSARIVAAKAALMVEAMKDCGCLLNNAYMQHSLLALVVIPALRISDAGLIDVTNFRKTDVFVK